MSITTNVASFNPTPGEVCSIKQYVMKFFSDLQQVSGFLQVFRFPPLINWCHDITEVLLKVALHSIIPNPKMIQITINIRLNFIVNI